MTDRPNAEQAEFWNGPAAHEWVRHWRWMDQVLEPLGAALLKRAAAQPGERVLDVGCAHGTTTVALAEQVGEVGWVLGLDISGVILDVARTRQRDAGCPQLTFEQGDATTHEFEAHALDLVVSRFGVMFFEDPTATFRHLRRALTPGGRLAFVCWQALPNNRWMTIGMEAASRHLDRSPRRLAIQRRPERDRAVSAVVDAYRPYLRDGAIRVPAAAWLVTAGAAAD